MQTEINYQQLGQRVREKRKAMNVQQKDKLPFQGKR